MDPSESRTPPGFSELPTPQEQAERIVLLERTIHEIGLRAEQARLETSSQFERMFALLGAPAAPLPTSSRTTVPPVTDPEAVPATAQVPDPVQPTGPGNQDHIPAFVFGSGNRSNAQSETAVPAAQADSEQDQRFKRLEEKMKVIQGADRPGDLDFSELALFGHVPRPEKFKVPDFEKFDGSGHPVVHLRIYLAKMSPYQSYPELMVQTFQESLKGDALTWFAGLKANQVPNMEELARLFHKQYKHNLDNAPTRLDLQNMEMKPDQTFKDYVALWRSKANCMNPPLTQTEAVPLFISTLKGIYYTQMMSQTAAEFSNLIMTGELIERGLKSGKLQDPHKVTTDNKKTTPIVGAVYPSQQWQQSPSPQMSDTPQLAGDMSAPTSQDKKRRQFTLLPIPLEEVYKKALAQQLIGPEVLGPHTRIQAREPQSRCEFHLGAPGHTTNNCPTLKHRIQDLIDCKLLVLNPVTPPGGNTNPPPKQAFQTT